MIITKILFMGTPDFAVFSLSSLYNAGYDIIGAVTQPDKPKSRGYKLMPPPVKVFAEEHGIPVYQPQTFKAGAFAQTLQELAPDLIAVTAYGKILPSYVLDYPRLGCINVHGSLLPKYRGAAPMQRAIIDGESVTGITIMHMAAGIDTGDMILSREVPIENDDNFESVHDKLGAVGGELLVEAVRMLEIGTAPRIVQDESLSSYAAKITPGDCVVDFSLPAKKLHNLIRGLSPIPLAYTHTPDGKLLKLVKSETVTNASEYKMAAPGTVVSTKSGIVIACGDGYLKITALLPEGKGRMSADDFVRGRKITLGDILG